MGLTPGTRVGPYEILAPLRAGGMGEVYRARDLKLNRAVAIKVLPATFASDPDRLARFEREAQMLAALNHPNIAHIYGFEASANALVMELVEGEDLSVIINRGALAVSDVLAIARQIAEAFEAAHEQGIIHRDLKPANVKVRADGTVKILDFGLAKALGPDGSNATADAMNSPTLTARGTELGMILGTAAYMAPEQARGKVVDRRADIWAFGVVLFEMLTGRRAFEGEDVSTTLAAVLMKDPDWNALPASTPAALRRLIHPLALGAAPGRVVRLVLGRVTMLVAAGIAIGAGVSLWAAHFVSALIFGLTPRDPVTLIGAGVVLAMVGALAGWVPARRASRIDPARVLREAQEATLAMTE